MTSHFEKLRDDEKKLMYRSPCLVAILLAGADDKIDNKELQEAVSFAKLKQSKGRDLLLDFYHEISESFENDLKEEIAALPHASDKRNTAIVDELRRLNLILPKLDRKFAIQFYESLKEIASTVARASGGIFGYLSVGYEEAKYVELNFVRNPTRYKKPENKA